LAHGFLPCPAALLPLLMLLVLLVVPPCCHAEQLQHVILL
jgi:hypothetical protein